MDSILSSRSTHDVEESTSIEASDSEEYSTRKPHYGRQSSNGSYDRYDTEHSWDDNEDEDECQDCSSNLEELTCLLKANSPDFWRLELDDPVESVPRFVEALRINKKVREVEVHIEVFQGLSQQDQTAIADAICALPELRSLLVYKNSNVFLEPLIQRRPHLLRHLRLCKLDIAESKNTDLLVHALEGLVSLKSLDVGFEAQSCDEVLRTLTQMKPSCPDLESFRVDYKLPQSMAGNHYALDDRIATVIAQAVVNSKTLKSLSLPPYGCSQQCHEVLIQLLHQNTVVERIDYWVRIASLYFLDSNDTIDHLLHLNRSGVRRLLRKEGGINSAELLDHVISNQGDLEVVHHLFSSDPSLVPAPNDY